MDGAGYVLYKGVNNPNLSGDHIVLVGKVANHDIGVPVGVPTPLVFSKNEDDNSIDDKIVCQPKNVFLKYASEVHTA